MNRTISRILWVIAGVLLIVAGVFCMASPAAALSGVTLLLGISMLFSGVVDLVIFATANRLMAGSGWFLVDGIVTVLLSLLILCDQWFTAMALPLVFGMWLLFSGITKFANSFDLKRLGVRGWGWFTALGAVMAAVGFFSFLEPLAGLVAMGVTVGLFLILEGVASILRGCFAHRFWL